jgi:carbon-monoxide dehydrogenase large subunit
VLISAACASLKLAAVLGVERDKVRVLTGNVGGSFGMKSAVYPEYLALLHAARALGRPVKWTDERSESFISDSHGRDHEMTAELALDTVGKFLAVRVTGYGNLGAYVSRGTPIPPTANAVKNTIGVYKTPLLEVSTKIVVTNMPPVGAYRGAGRPEGNYYMERLVDTVAAEMGIDKIELRRRNHIPERAMPHKAPNGTTYDSGEFTAVLNEALAQADWDGFAARKEESRKRGLLRGIGIGDYLEVTGPPANEMGGIRFEPNGDVTIITGTLDYGQGHWTPFAQVLHQQLGVPFDRIRLLQGDSDELIAGGGTGGSKSLMASGTAIVAAGEKVIAQGRQIAAHVLEAAVVDVEFSRGRFTIAGTDRFIDIVELATMLRRGLQLPAELPQTLDVQHIHESSPSAFPNGCHIAEVEIDPETGVVAVVKYSMVNDFGVIVNPLLVAGQAHGGVMQGIGQALMERTVFDEDGQFLTNRLLYGLWAAPRLRCGDVRDRQPSGPSQDQSARRQGLRRGWVRRIAAGGDERRRRRALGIRRPPHRHARDSAKDMASNPTGAVAELVCQPVASPNCEWWGPVPRCWRYSKQIGRRLCRREQRSAQNQRRRATFRRWHTRR